MKKRTKEEIDSFLTNTILRKRKRNISSYINFSFLCGKGKKDGETNSRDKLTEEVFNKSSDIYPIIAEDLYNIFREEKLDVLTIEEILFSFSTALIIIVESFGSACELGAFARKEYLDKVWVIEDKKCEK